MNLKCIPYSTYWLWNTPFAEQTNANVWAFCIFSVHVNLPRFICLIVCLFISISGYLSMHLNGESNRWSIAIHHGTYPIQIWLPSMIWHFIHFVSIASWLELKWLKVVPSKWIIISILQVVKTIKRHGLKRIRPNCIFRQTFSKNWFQTHFCIGPRYGKLL